MGLNFFGTRIWLGALPRVPGRCGWVRIFFVLSRLGGYAGLVRMGGERRFAPLLRIGGPILNDLGIFQTLTDQNVNKHPQNNTKKPERWGCSGFFVLFCHIVQYVHHRMLTLFSRATFIFKSYLLRVIHKATLTLLLLTLRITIPEPL